jgi:predicted phosphodiesterase
MSNLSRLCGILAIATCCWAASAQGAEKTNSAAATAQPAMAINHGPILQAPSETAMTVSWATTRPALSWVEYQPEGLDRWLTNYPARHGLVEALHTFHNVQLTDLKPGTTYIYRAASREINDYKAYSVKFGATVVSRDFRLTTLDRAKSEFTFVVVSDRHEQVDVLHDSWKSVDWQSVDLALLNGDMVHACNGLDQMLRMVMDPCVEHFASTKPLIYARGNHETRGFLARSLLEYFPTRSGRFYYTLRHGPVMFLVLDCGEDKRDDDVEYYGLTAFRPYMEEQARWLEKAIQQPDFRQAPFRVCILHIPPGNRENPRFTQTRWLWDHITPLLNKGKVDLLLSGHTHRDEAQPAGIEGFEFPLITTGTRTVLRADVTPKEIRVTRSVLSGETLPELIIKRAGK